jgi:hypothetical protein
VVVSLDTALVDLTAVFAYSLAILAGDLDQETPTATQVAHTHPYSDEYPADACETPYPREE